MCYVPHSIIYSQGRFEVPWTIEVFFSYVYPAVEIEHFMSDIIVVKCVMICDYKANYWFSRLKQSCGQTGGLDQSHISPRRRHVQVKSLGSRVMFFSLIFATWKLRGPSKYNAPKKALWPWILSLDKNWTPGVETFARWLLVLWYFFLSIDSLNTVVTHSNPWKERIRKKNEFTSPCR